MSECNVSMIVHLFHSLKAMTMLTNSPNHDISIVHFCIKITAPAEVIEEAVESNRRLITTNLHSFNN